jgi:oxygen-independent coproporphyrinogen-3 oxidase
VHLPWCVRKCPYCDFNSHPLRADVPEDAYVQALLAEADQRAPEVHGRTISSVFMGGGTPSLFSPGAIGRILDGLAVRFHLAGDVEITLEANPGTLDDARLAGFRAAGVNRLSLGVQSFNDHRLRAIGRIHDARQALDAVLAARRAGFDDLNLDLMYGLPGQTVAQVEGDLATAVALAPEHLSWYALTIEPDTPFGASPPPLPDEDTRWAMQEAGASRLAAAGYTQYEVSAHARPGRRCRHNLNYWRYGDYLGLGAGAHGKLTDRRAARILRTRNLRSPARYMAGVRRDGEYQKRWQVSREDSLFEFMLNALRLAEGFTLRLFAERTGLEARVLQARLEDPRRRGLITVQDDTVVPTALGWRFLDDLAACFLP